jgi:hypothetical protein
VFTKTSRTQDPPRSGLHSERSKFSGCSIASTGSRYVVLPPAHAARTLTFGRVNIGIASLHRPLCLKTERGCSKICHTSALSSQCTLQRLAPRLVSTRHALPGGVQKGSLRRNLRRRSLSTRKTSILQFKIWSRADELGSIKQDLAPGGEQFLSRSRVHTPPGMWRVRTFTYPFLRSTASSSPAT